MEHTILSGDSRNSSSAPSVPIGRPLLAALILFFCVTFSALASAQTFDFGDVARQAQKLAKQDFKETSVKLPRELQSLTYDQFRDIRFKPEKALWRDAKLPFEAMFFHQGFFFDRPVRISEVRADGVHDIQFSPDQFDYGKNAPPKDSDGLGFSGFRIHYPINTGKYKDEVAVFLGASYFRAVGKDQLYGLSARGLAVDTALASGEEFPRFVRFWLVRPNPQARELTIYALLDSPRVTGAYRFVIVPGAETIADVKARIFLRKDVGKLGIAPLTSMYFFGADKRPPYEDFRPQVHDSDGLSIQSGSSEWIWRPLQNPPRLLVTSFTLDSLAGFGLMQRGRDFSTYQDLESRYEKRPSAWVEPKSAWGRGRVELVQIPTPDETNDNIVAYWIPDKAPVPLQPFDLDYRIRWQKDKETKPPLAWVAQTRRGHAYIRQPDNSINFIIDFEGPALQRLTADDAVEAAVTADDNGEIASADVHRNDVTKGYRISLRVKPKDAKKPVELRAALRDKQQTLSETWSYVLSP